MQWLNWGSALGAFMLLVGLMGLLVLHLGCPDPRDNKALPPPREVAVVRLPEDEGSRASCVTLAPWREADW